MVRFEKRGDSFAVTARGVDLSKPLSDADFADVLWGIGTHGVVCFPDQQHLGPAELHGFSSRFGRLHQSSVNTYFVPGLPAVTILSNIRENGKQIGVEDAGQEWHSDMSYTKALGFINVLLARKVPMRDGRPLGATLFVNAQAAYDDLSADVKKRLEHATVTHFLGKYWDYVRTVKGSNRPPLTEQQLRDWPPVSHPIFMTHPITGRKLIFANPSFTVKIDGMAESESEAMLSFLFDHMLQDKYRYTHEWSVGDLLIFDLIGTWHNATPDYNRDEPRLMERCQVLANQVLNPAFVSAALAERAPAGH
jgi:taurine dioxygenase